MNFNQIATNVWSTMAGDLPCQVTLAKASSRDHGKPQEKLIAKVMGVAAYATTAPCNAIPSDTLKQWRKLARENQ